MRGMSIIIANYPLTLPQVNIQTYNGLAQTWANPLTFWKELLNAGKK